MKCLLKIVTLITLLLFFGGPVSVSNVFAQESEKAGETEDGDPAEAQPKRLWEGTEIRFITDSDFPPFNYFDEEGVLTGLNVDLARAICLALDVRCDIQARDWDSHITALEGNEADAIIASLAISPRNLDRLDFTKPYFQLPARFATRKDSKIKDVRPETVKGTSIGVIRGTAHEAYINSFFGEADIKSYESAEQARRALREEKIVLLFDDGVSLMFWLNGTLSNGCCEFRGGPFVEAKFFGQGIGVAVKKGNRKLLKVLNQALDMVREEGRMEQLYLRYFPLRFY